MCASREGGQCPHRPAEGAAGTVAGAGPKEPGGSIGVEVQTVVFILSAVGILTSKDSISTCFLRSEFFFPFLKQYESIS